MEPTSALGFDTPKHPADGQQPVELRAATSTMSAGDNAHSEGCTVPSHWLSQALDTWLQNGDHTPPGVTATTTH